jgi:tetratricopeptide (TPR) repeat protein
LIWLTDRGRRFRASEAPVNGPGFLRRAAVGGVGVDRAHRAVEVGGAADQARRRGRAGAGQPGGTGRCRDRDARREQGDHAAARALSEESLALHRATGDRAGVADALAVLAEAAHALGDHSAARALYEQAWQLTREVGHPKQLPWPPHNLGCLALDRGDYPAARTLLTEALALRRTHDDTMGTLYSLLAFASLAAAEGRPARALRLGGAATQLAGVIGVRLVPTYRTGFERRLATARQALSAEAAAAAWSAGQALSLEEAVAEALGEDLPA